MRIFSVLEALSVHLHSINPSSLGKSLLLNADSTRFDLTVKYILEDIEKSNNIADILSIFNNLSLLASHDLTPGTRMKGPPIISRKKRQCEYLKINTSDVWVLAERIGLRLEKWNYCVQYRCIDTAHLCMLNMNSRDSEVLGG